MMLTLDLDTKSKRLALNKGRLLKCIFGKPTYMRVSSSGNGYHAKVHGLDPANYPFELRLLLRYWLGDDRRRVIMDNKRSKLGICTDVLFTCKGENYASEWEEIKLGRDDNGNIGF